MTTHIMALPMDVEYNISKYVNDPQQIRDVFGDAVYYQYVRNMLNDFLKQENYKRSQKLGRNKWLEYHLEQKYCTYEISYHSNNTYTFYRIGYKRNLTKNEINNIQTDASSILNWDGNRITFWSIIPNGYHICWCTDEIWFPGICKKLPDTIESVPWTELETSMEENKLYHYLIEKYGIIDSL